MKCVKRSRATFRCRENLVAMVRPRDQNASEKIGESSSVEYTEEKVARIVQGSDGVITSSILLDPGLVWSHHNCQRLLKNAKYFNTS